MPTLASIVRRTVGPAIFVALGALAMWAGPGAVQTARLRYAAMRPGATTEPATKPIAVQVDTWTVKRDDMRITFTESGKLRAIKSYPIFATINNQQLKIAFLAAEGAMVKKGDLIASFDKKAFEDVLQTQRGELEGAERTLTVNQAALEIARSTGKSNVATAGSKLEEASVLYKTYREMEGPKKLNELDASMNEARGKMTTAQKLVVDAQQKIDDGLFSEESEKKALETELDNAKDSARTFQKSVDAFALQRKIFRAYEYPQSLKSKKQAVESAQMDVEKSQVSADNEVNGKQAEVAKVQDQIRRLKREIEDIEDNLKKCELTAPVDGLVVYGDPSSPYIRYDNQIKVGAEWFGGQVLMTIPDLSAFELDIQVAESYVGRVKVGMPVSVTFEAVPGLQLGGSLNKIAKLGRPRERYDPSSPRVFDTAVSLSGSDERLVSGMTGRVEILADEIKGAMLLPMDAIVAEQGKTYVDVREPDGKTQRREITVGRSNNSMVEVTKGLGEGDRIALGSASGPASK